MIQFSRFTVLCMRIVCVSILLVIQSFLVSGAAYANEAPLEKDEASLEKGEVCVYTVRKGDTFSHIALKLTGTVKNYPQLMDINHLDSERLYVGNTLFIPIGLLTESALSRCEPQILPVSTHENDEILADLEVLVFEDVNGNGQPDTDESGVSGINVILVRGKVIRTTDTQGIVVFREIDPGHQAVGLDEGELPEGYRLTTHSQVLISLTEGDRGYVNFGIQRDAGAQPEASSTSTE